MKKQILTLAMLSALALSAHAQQPASQLLPYQNPNLSAEARAKNLERFAYEDSIRHAYLATFYNKESALQALKDNDLAAGSEENTQKMVKYLVGSSGNHRVILTFLKNHKDRIDRAIKLLGTLSAKDLRDMQISWKITSMPRAISFLLVWKTR